MPTEPPTTVTLGDQTIAFDDATWEEIVGAMVVDALSLTKAPNPIQADRVSAMGNPTARRVASLVKHVGKAGPKWRASRRRRGSPGDRQRDVQHHLRVLRPTQPQGGG